MLSLSERGVRIFVSLVATFETRRLKLFCSGKMNTLFIVLCAILPLYLCNPKLLNFDESDKIIGLVSRAGYRVQAHMIETEDGYLLKVHRLLPKFNGNKKPVSMKPPVCLMHGVLSSAADFLITGPKIALAYMLADNGYDGKKDCETVFETLHWSFSVWLGNSRGSLHSMNHRNYTIDSDEFWRFSWHEIGVYDLPAIIDYMLTSTKAPRAFFVGHSQATSSLLVMLSMLPSYNEKIIQAHLLAPTAFVSDSPHHFFRTLITRLGKNQLEANFMNFAPFLQLGKFLSLFTCSGMQTPMVGTCGGIIMLFNFVFGTNKKDLEIDTVQI